MRGAQALDRAALLRTPTELPAALLAAAIPRSGGTLEGRPNTAAHGLGGGRIATVLAETRLAKMIPVRVDRDESNRRRAERAGVDTTLRIVSG